MTSDLYPLEVIFDKSFMKEFGGSYPQIFPNETKQKLKGWNLLGRLRPELRLTFIVKVKDVQTFKIKM